MSWNSADETRPTTGRCLVLHPFLKLSASDRSGNGGALRDPQGRLEEATRLAEAIELEIHHAEIITINRPKPASLLGGGTVERLEGYIAHHEIEVVVMDAALSPVQQRNLEQAWKAKVIDRTGLILEIFGARARTKVGTLQVELAALSYQRSRLVRSWTHLERQRGGFGFMGGPGERQIEADRRLIDERITSLKRQLKDVRRTRQLHRKARQRVPYPVVALVGYTNAGKSTLFNSLSNADVASEDQLFATLDPTMRSLKLPSGREVILSDTVGFVSDLPLELIESFSATLEEVQEADLLLHIRDISHIDAAAQKEDVELVLKNLGVSEASELTTVASVPLIEVLNKSDLLSLEERDIQTTRANRRNDQMVLVSAITGDGFAKLLKTVDDRLTARRQEVTLKVSWEEGGVLAWLYERGEVIERHDKEEWVELKVRLEPEDIARYEQKKIML
ncbi:MAG: GTPase HflX [Rhodospirillales bacterium]|nr:GTPase HflX [Rhodospirillales bacterium]